MRRLSWLTAIVVVASFAACAGRAPPQVTPASAISARGFAVHGFDAPSGVGRALTLRGYVDPANLYGDAGAKAILGEWWSGDGPDPSTWRFNLKAHAGDGAGQSFPVHIASDAGRDELLHAMVADARAGRPTPVVVRGTVTTFDAPMNMVTRRGLLMTVGSSRDVRRGDAATDAGPP
jgi:hypothetical protein